MTAGELVTQVFRKNVEGITSVHIYPDDPTRGGYIVRINGEPVRCDTVADAHRFLAAVTIGISTMKAQAGEV